MAARTEPVRVLLVEDDEDDYLITGDMLAAQDRTRFALDWCASYDAALASIAQETHDVYLIDYRLGLRTGLELIRQAFATRQLAPVILLTGQSDYQIDLEATALGVTDYLVKDEIGPTTLERSIRYAISHHRAMANLARSEERYALAVRAANDGIWDWDLEADTVYFSPRWYAILGLDEQLQDPSPQTWFDLVHPDDLNGLQAAIDLHLHGEAEHLASEHRMRHADGTWRWVLSRGLAIRDTNARVTRMAGSLTDITERHLAQRKLQHDALHDALTGLPNRVLFADRVDQLLARSQRQPGMACAVLFLDIDRFKLVNDSLSHLVGDQLLVAFAARLRSILRPGDTVARVGGDEFTILLADGVDEPGALLVAGRLQDQLRAPFRLGGRELFLSASVGIALSHDRLSASELVRNADIAMYDAKRSGRGQTAVFDQSMHRRVVTRLSRENELRAAVEGRLIEAHFQPIVDLASGRITGVEALARWPQDWEHVGPLEFIAIAEETGLVGTLGEQVLRQSLQALAGWRAEGAAAPTLQMSVNVSSRQLDDPELPDRIRAALAEAELPASLLRLEITESTLMREPERLPQLVDQVCAAGTGLHLDDFGTGYSSLASLHRMPVEALKIDRGFIAAILHDSGSDAIVRSTIALAHSLGLVVIAEGIEEEGQLDRLRELGCDLGQGFLFSPPLPAARIGALLRAWEKSAAAPRRLVPSA